MVVLTRIDIVAIWDNTEMNTSLIHLDPPPPLLSNCWRTGSRLAPRKGTRSQDLLPLETWGASGSGCTVAIDYCRWCRTLQSTHPPGALKICVKSLAMSPDLFEAEPTLYQKRKPFNQICYTHVWSSGGIRYREVRWEPLLKLFEDGKRFCLTREANIYHKDVWQKKNISKSWKKWESISKRQQSWQPKIVWEGTWKRISQGSITLSVQLSAWVS